MSQQKKNRPLRSYDMLGDVYVPSVSPHYYQPYQPQNTEEEQEETLLAPSPNVCQ